MTSEWFVPGEPSVWLGSGEKAWKLKLAEAVRFGELPHALLELDFRVASFLRSGHPYDLDNMVTPVFEAVLGPRHSPLRRALTCWRALRMQDSTPGLLLRGLSEVTEPFQSGNAAVVLDVVLDGQLPRDSRDGGISFVEGVVKALGPWIPDRTHRFAVELGFGNNVRDITWVAEAPIKPVVDCLFPVLGGSPGAPHDWKINALQVMRGRSDLGRGCAIKIWALSSEPAPLREGPSSTAVVTLPSEVVSGPPVRKGSGMTQSECLAKAAADLGSPPAGIRIGEVLERAKALFPEMHHVSKDSAAATMDFQTINVRGRANRPGDFTSGDKWNRSPSFVKVDRGVWRRLSEKEQAAFIKLWATGEPLLRRESYDVRDWEDVFRRWDASTTESVS